MFSNHRLALVNKGYFRNIVEVMSPIPGRRPIIRIQAKEELYPGNAEESSMIRASHRKRVSSDHLSVGCGIVLREEEIHTRALLIVDFLFAIANPFCDLQSRIDSRNR